MEFLCTVYSLILCFEIRNFSFNFILTTVVSVLRVRVSLQGFIFNSERCYGSLKSRISIRLKLSTEVLTPFVTAKFQMLQLADQRGQCCLKIEIINGRLVGELLHEEIQLGGRTNWREFVFWQRSDRLRFVIDTSDESGERISSWRYS